jgi:hypothetical protein
MTCESKRYKGLGRVMPNRVVAEELQEIARQTPYWLFDRRWRQRLLNNGLLMVKTTSEAKCGRNDHGAGDKDTH